MSQVTSSMISPELASSEDGPFLLASSMQSSEIRVTGRHRHARGQLLGAKEGLLSVDAGASRWVVPATHAVWIPPDIPHSLRSHGAFAGWSLYVAASACEGLPSEPCILSVSALLKEAVARAAAWAGVPALDAAQSRLAGVILDEIAASPQVALGLPMPRDARLLKIARALAAKPHDERKLDDWAVWAGMSPRTLTRRFVAETGFSFTEWRQRLRLLHALEMLAAGKPVTAMALDLGYGNASAFIALFRRTFGVTPGRYEPVRHALPRHARAKDR